jgi:hypothetical protein
MRITQALARPRRALAILPLLLALGCGGDDSSESPSGDTTTTTGECRPTQDFLAEQREAWNRLGASLTVEVGSAGDVLVGDHFVMAPVTVKDLTTCTGIVIATLTVTDRTVESDVVRRLAQMLTGVKPTEDIVVHASRGRACGSPWEGWTFRDISPQDGKDYIVQAELASRC